MLKGSMLVARVGTLCFFFTSRRWLLSVSNPAGSRYSNGWFALPTGERALLEAAKQYPNDFTAQQRLGEFYLQQNRLLLGILYLQKAQHLNPQDYNTGYDLSLAYLNSAHTVKASAQLHHMIAQHETAELDNLLAEVSERSGDYKAPRPNIIVPPSWIRVRKTSLISPLFFSNIQNYQGFLGNASNSFRTA